MLEIKHNSSSVKDTLMVSQAVGHKVIGKNGSELGKVKELAIDPRKMTVEGVYVSPCFTCADEYIGKEYIETISVNGIVLKIDPLTEVIGKKVFDSTGKQIGKVSALTREKKTNTINQIEVNPGLGKKNILVSMEDVKSLGEAVVLSKTISA
ncbi:MAG: PRC-barrel domain-containing protein [archaeon]|jgi:sporulation protein YlmC with PRC-barrel domain